MNAASESLLTSKQLATFLHLSEQTIRRYRSNGHGPRYTKLGSGKSARILYRMSDVEDFLRSNTLSFSAGVRGVA